MKTIQILALSIVLVFARSPAFAIDCKRASTPVETAICEDDELKAKDAALGDAYFKLLKQTTDARVHDLLVFSQKRWLKTREDKFKNQEFSSEDLSPGIDQRLKELTGKYRPFTGRIADALSFASRFSGGPYAGSKIDCFFSDTRETTAYCFGDVTFQNDDRICRQTVSITAFGQWTEYRTVGRIVGGKAGVVATCSSGKYAEKSTDDECPDLPPDKGRAPRYGWKLRPNSADSDFPQFQIFGRRPNTALVDPDVNVSGSDSAWVEKCLTDPTYPMSEPHHD